MKSCQTWLCIEGNGMRPSHLGVGMSANAPMYTLNTTEVHVVMFKEDTNGDMGNESWRRDKSRRSLRKGCESDIEGSF